MRIRDALIFQRAMLAVAWLGILTGFGMIVACGGGGSSPSSASAPNAPKASISSPTGTYFKEGENITFSGSATDAGGGELTGSALVWTSNIDGRIGVGKTLITSALSAGDHEITLTATDSNGSTVTVPLSTLTVAQTRFVKIGLQTSGVIGAFKAFDGDQAAPAVIERPWAEDGHFDYLHFRAYLGDANTFIFRIALGSSTVGSTLVIDGLTSTGEWKNLSAITLDQDKIFNLQIPEAQNYKDGDNYINLRARWVGGQPSDDVPIYEIWRADPIFAGAQTSQSVVSSELAFDGDPATYTAVPAFPDYLHFKFFVGPAETAVFKISLDALGNYNTLYIDAEQSPDSWSTIDQIDFTSTQTMTLTITISDAQDYLDADGYISLRALWTGPSIVNLKIREVWRNDPFLVGSKTSAGIVDSSYAVDGKKNTGAQINYYWDEDGHKDFLQLRTFVGDADKFTFYASLSQSTAGSLMVIDAEIAPDTWTTLTTISLDSAVDSQPVTITNAHDYTDADGFISLRFLWEGGSPGDSAYALINEIWQ
jgi:hypothetical protein